MTLVSVIIPCFNRERFIGEAIESALRQSHAQTEVIVVDDGSTDGSWGVISSFGRRVQAVRVGNGGVSRARNIGIARARGSLVKFLDSDDLLEPDVLERQAGEIAALPDRSLTMGTVRWIGDDGVPLAPPVPPLPAGWKAVPLPLERVLRFEHVTLSGAMIPAAAFRETGGFREDLRLAEDYDMILRLCLAGYRLFLSGTPSTAMRVHAGPRLSASPDGSGYAQLAEWFETTLAACDARASGPLSAAERAAFAQLVWTRARGAVRSGYTAEARRLFGLASGMAGRRARIGAAPLMALYNLFDPVTCERIAEAGKRLLRRKAPWRPVGAAPGARQAG